MRPWKENAAELLTETNSKKVEGLSKELIAALEDQERRTAQRERPPENLSRRVLFVDDEPSIRATLAMILRQRGFEVIVADNIPEAVREIQSHTFDILLSDLHVNKPSDGFDLVRAMRKVNPQCVAIILTAYPGLESAVEGIEEKIDDYLLKPVDKDLLVATLERRLAERTELLRAREQNGKNGILQRES